jgi:hypothetical protein
MSTGLRLVLVLPTDEVVRLSLARFDRLYARPPADRLPELAGQRVRAAEAAVELEAGRPVQVVRVVYHYLHFDAGGVLDVERLRRDGMIAFEAGTSTFVKPRDGDPGVVEARNRFVRRRRDHEVWWTPSTKLAQQIASAALDDTRYRRLSARRA